MHNPPMISRTERIRSTLTETFAPLALELKDDSAKHAKHATRMEQPGHAPDGGETHYRLTMVSPRFTGMSRVTRSRAVHEALDSEFKSGLHALALDLKAPGEV
ncbi:MAG: BolA family transcriptional regulator [Acidiphilium sp.]|nr:BolA family transcriptional regulator [Acidiphilium sp.]MDD4934598.1 BolA family transcriptional regulator [Acidiphilium sp.]